jgi:hypothetical protein
MNKRLGFFTLLLVVPLLGAPSFSEAWEFTIDSALLNFRYVYASQAGPQGFFGPFNVDMSSQGVGDLAPLNGWFQRKMISGTTAMNYMIASNLNILASVMKGDRSSRGYSWGYVAPDTDPLNFGSLNFNNRGSFISPVPSIPDNDLGWEFNVGIAWKLLENWRISGRGAYWQPVKWFNYACVDKSTPNWDAPNSGNNFGTNPNRTIAPILGVEIYIDARL